MAALLLTLLGSSSAWAQLTGTKAIPGDYASLSAAITDLNTAGVGAGGVTFNVAAGYTETAANLTITATGTAANPIVFQKSGSGANPLISAGVGASTSLDGVIRLSGADYVTFDGIDVAENAANTTATTQMEFGYVLMRASATDGCQNNIIRNSVVTLLKTNTATIGIAGVAFTSASSTTLAATSTAGANSNNLVYGNVVTNATKGIDFSASSSATTANYDQNNQVGLTPTGAAAGNTVGNFGSTASGWGIGASYQNGFKVSNNTVNSTLNYTSATASTPVAASTVTTTLRGIYGNTGTSANLDIVNNTITVASGATTSLLAGIDNGIGSTAASNTVNITGNTISGCSYATATSGSFAAIQNTASAATVTISGNIVTGNVIPGTGDFNAITGGSPTALNLTNNRITDNSKTGSATVYCLRGSSTNVTATGNTVSNFTVTTSGSAAGTLYGYYNAGSPTGETLTGNTFTGLTIGGTTTSTSSAVYGFYNNGTSSTPKAWNQNVVGGLSSSVSGSVYGIYPGLGATIGVAGNKVYDLAATGTGAAVYGLYISSGTTVTATNNLIGDLRAPSATGVNAISGVYVGGGTTVNLYYNTVYLNATSSSTTTFGSSGVYVASATPALTQRNNIVVNNSTPGATGGAAAAFRYTAAPATTSFLAASNNNLYYAGTPAANRVIYVEGTATLANAQQTLAAYKGYIGSRDQLAVTENPPFLSTTGTDATFLHINPATATQVEAGGAAISGVTTDFDGDTRNTTTPDLGADEGTFTPLDLSGPTISFTALGNTPSTTNRTLVVTISDPSGVATGTNAPRLYFRKGTSGAFVFVNATSVSGNSYTFTFDYSLVGGVTGFDPVQYYVAAQDVLGNVSTNPAGGGGATPPGTTTPSTIYQFFVQGALAGTYYVGTGTSPAPARTYPTLTAAISAYNNNTLGGAVTFLLLDATYSTAESFPLVIAPNADASAVNTLTIKPNTGVTSSITGSNATAILALNGADYVTIDGTNGGTISGTDARPNRALTITNTNAGTGSTGILVTVPTSGTETSNNNSFQNLTLVGSGSAATLAGIAITTAATNTAGNAGNTVQNVAVQAAQYGIYSFGTSATVKNTGTIITQNDLNATGTAKLGRVGIIVGFENNIQITRNTVSGIDFSGTGDVAGISVGMGLAYSTSTFTGSEVTNATISRNYIGSVRQTGTYSAAGIGLASATSGTSTIDNNFVAGVSSNGTSGDYGVGIFVGGGTGSTTRVVFNSVSMTGTQTGGNYPGFALAIGGTTPTVEIRNNILLNTQTTGSGKGVAIGLAYSSTAGAYAGLTSSNNDFFVGTGTGFALGQTGGLSTSGTSRNDLAAWNTETGQDAPATSKQVDPQFASATDLHTQSASLNNAGVPVSGITVDFDGETRNASTPDIGGDEFTPASLDIAASELISPATSGCYGATEAVTVRITSQGVGTLNFATNPVTVTVVVTPPSGTAQTFTTTVNTGTLASAASQNVTLPGTLNMTAAGTYSFAVSATVTGDGNTANDQVTATRTVTAPVAQGQVVTFTGFTGSNLSTVFPGWSEAVGATAPTGTTSAWTNGTIPAGNTTAKINLYDLGKNDWIVSPKFLATSSTVLTFDAGLSDYNSSSADPAGMTGTDDFAEVRISTDCGLTFTRIPGFAQFNAANQPSNGSLTSYSINLGGYAGQQIIVAIFASEGTVNDTPDYDFHVDNLRVNSPVTIDLAATALAAPTATQGCYSAAEAVTVTVRNEGTQTLDFAVNPATVTAVVTTPSGPQTLTGTVSTGTLAAGATQNVTLTGTLNMSTTGAYAFALTATVTGDLNTSNDALTPAVTRTVAAPVAGTATASSRNVCVSGTVTLTLTGAANGSIQWQQSTDNTTFTDISGATAATYTTPVLTSVTYYRAQVRCSAQTAATSNVLTISVSNPTVTTTNTPVAVCSGNTATLTATAATGTSLRFFEAATGGTALATGTSFTTPALTASRQYFVEAFSGVSETVGKASTNGGDGTNTSGGLYFTTTDGLTIRQVTVYRAASAAAGTATIQLLSGSSTAAANVISSVTVNVPANTSTSVSPTDLTVNLAVPSAGTYTLYLSASSPGLVRDYTAATPATAFPYNSASGLVSITGATLSGYYYFFYNWQVSNECTSATRTAIQVNVTTPAVAAFSYPATGSNCAGATGTVAATLGTGATAGTFTSTTGLSLNATTGAINLTASTAGTYTVTNTVAAAGGCGPVTSTATVTISPRPAQPTVTVQYTTPGTAILTASAAPAGGTYQWFLGGTGITGATSQTYTANGTAQPGAYTVVVTSAQGCASPASAALTVTAASKPLAGSSLTLFPNPTPNGQLTLQLSGYTKAVELTVLDATGRVVYTHKVAAGQTQQTIDLGQVARGVYLLRAVTEGGTDTRRIVRE
ncbi:T9SS type A sorting domain-containing protein [Hymenobacter edaphi]|uniref:Ig-like domain-containing protein n=1 Tax=Hymenobacter edaphi TaxID=2211146 RepID=UPI001403C0F6|nr:T9SS type A sorting domain-containing protein [Hymenobacter edaphi]